MVVYDGIHIRYPYTFTSIVVTFWVIKVVTPYNKNHQRLGTAFVCSLRHENYGLCLFPKSKEYDFWAMQLRHVKENGRLLRKCMAPPNCLLLGLLESAWIEVNSSRTAFQESLIPEIVTGWSLPLNQGFLFSKWLYNFSQVQNKWIQKST